jgi:hypothetical protein
LGLLCSGRHGAGLRGIWRSLSIARKGSIDHQFLSFDAYVKFIEDDFMDGQRLDPKKDVRPDPRRSVRESASQLGDLRRDFDFNQPVRTPACACHRQMTAARHGHGVI